MFFQVIDLGHNIRKEQVTSNGNVCNHFEFMMSDRIGELASDDFVYFFPFFYLGRIKELSGFRLLKKV